MFRLTLIILASYLLQSCKGRSDYIVNEYLINRTWYIEEITYMGQDIRLCILSNNMSFSNGHWHISSITSEDCPFVDSAYASIDYMINVDSENQRVVFKTQSLSKFFSATYGLKLSFDEQNAILVLEIRSADFYIKAKSHNGLCVGCSKNVSEMRSIQELSRNSW